MEFDLALLFLTNCSFSEGPDIDKNLHHGFYYMVDVQLLSLNFSRA